VVLPVLLVVVGETQPARATMMAVAVAVGNKRKDGNMAVDYFYVRCSWIRKLLRTFLNYLRAINSTYLRENVVDNLRLS
jgi:hypothetical protein